MEFSQLVKEVSKLEGFSAVPYTCPGGSLTIGYGKRIKASEQYLYNLYTQENFYFLLESDLLKLYRYIDILFDKQSPYKGNTNILFALTDFAYNIGTKNLLSTKTVLGTYFSKICSKSAQSDDLYQLGSVMLRYCHVGKKPLRGLQKRRIFDFNLLLSGF